MLVECDCVDDDFFLRPLVFGKVDGSAAAAGSEVGAGGSFFAFAALRMNLMLTDTESSPSETLGFLSTAFGFGASSTRQPTFRQNLPKYEIAT